MQIRDNPTGAELTMPLITQYRAAKIAGVSKTAINKKTKKNPVPGFFIMTRREYKGKKQDIYMVDPDHPTWKMYLENLKLRESTKGIGERKYSADEVRKMVDSAIEEAAETAREEATERVGRTMAAVLVERLGLGRKELESIIMEIERKVKGI